MKKTTQSKKKKYPESLGKFTINNFRVFEEENSFDFKPITFLVGPNSSGKSSLMKLLAAISSSIKNSKRKKFIPNHLKSALNNDILFRANLPVNNEHLVLKLEGDSAAIKLGLDFIITYGQSKLKKNQLDLVKFEITVKGNLIFSIESLEDRDFRLTLSLKKFLGIAQTCLKMDLENINKRKYVFGDEIEAIEGIIQCETIFNFDNPSDELIQFQPLLDLEKKITESKELLIFDAKTMMDVYELFFRDSIHYDDIIERGLVDFIQSFFYVLKNIIINSLSEKGGKVKLIESQLGTYLSTKFPERLVSLLNYSLDKKMCFLHASVLKSERTHFFNMNENHTTSFGVLMKSYISENKMSFVGNTLFSNDYIDMWLLKFSIGKSLVIKSVEDSDQYFIIEIEKTNGEIVNISDLGYGAGQVLAYIMLPFYMNVEFGHIIGRFIVNEKEDSKKKWEEFKDTSKRKIEFNPSPSADGSISTFNLYLEEPETNLHPNWQSILAELIVYQISIGIRFVIETHSEYLIRKIQSLIAQKKCDHNDVVIYYFNSEEERRKNNKPSSYQIKINENGTLSESFGAGFFDEAGRLTLDLLTINSISKN